MAKTMLSSEVSFAGERKKILNIKVMKRSIEVTSRDSRHGSANPLFEKTGLKHSMSVAHCVTANRDGNR
ncbi:MAG: hypothetical protein IJP68_04540, partial [Selenomonadaceae bacterium]|nr:hypothetical protein [Selenomonadaceae bacterium]